ncbi:MAG: ParB N-terminal domain-containing protein [Telluria sp.]
MQPEFVSLKVAAEKKIHGDDVAKATHFNVKPLLIKVRPGFNRPICRDNVEQFKTAIRAGATIPPIYVYVDAGVIELVDGEHRWIAVCELIAEGVDIPYMAAIQFRGNDADRIAHLLTSAQGKPLSPLESGLQYLKLLRLNWDVKQIAARIGRSVTHVDQCIVLAESNTDVQEHVRNGDVSGTTAAKIVRKHGSGAGAVIKDKLTEAKAAGKKRVTAASDKPKAPTDELIAAIKEIPLWIGGEWADKIRVLIAKCAEAQP